MFWFLTNSRVQLVNKSDTEINTFGARALVPRVILCGGGGGAHIVPASFRVQLFRYVYACVRNCSLQRLARIRHIHERVQPISMTLFTRILCMCV